MFPGAHHLSKEYFRKQRAAGSIMGPEGDGWPRFAFESPNHCGMVGMPVEMQEDLCDRGEWTATPDGRRWPKPTQVLMEPGDVAFTVYNMPHAVSAAALSLSLSLSGFLKGLTSCCTRLGTGHAE